MIKKLVLIILFLFTTADGSTSLIKWLPQINLSKIPHTYHNIILSDIDLGGIEIWQKNNQDKWSILPQLGLVNILDSRGY